jgi:nuclear pore complex protein Nup54
LQKFIAALQRKHELDISMKTEQYKRRHLELCHKVLIVMKKVETLRNRGYSLSVQEEQFRTKVENLQRELSQPNLYKVFI